MTFKYKGMSIEEYILQDRQWLKHVRIKFATIQEQKAAADAERAFWHRILELNGEVVS